MQNKNEKRKIKILSGFVVSDKMDKTIVVKVSRRMRHPLYKKIITRSNRYMAHDDKSESKTGDFVEIKSIRPLSKNKSWKLSKVITKV